MILPSHSKLPAFIGLCVNYWGALGGDQGAVGGRNMRALSYLDLLASYNDWCKGSCNKYVMKDGQKTRALSPISSSEGWELWGRS